MSDGTDVVERLVVHIDEEVLDDLHERLARTPVLHLLRLAARADRPVLRALRRVCRTPVSTGSRGGRS